MLQRVAATMIGLIALLFFLAGFAKGQNYEYADPSELKGLKTYWVDTSGDVKARNKIVEIVKKELPSLSIVDEITSAQIRIAYLGQTEEGPTNIIGGSNRASIETERLPVGAGMVWIDPRGTDKSKLRLVISFCSRKDFLLEKQPYEKLTKEFVKVYKKANGLK